MKLSLNKLKVDDGLSEETVCFTAELCLTEGTGKPFKIADVSNDGHGGAHDIRFEDDQRHREAEIEAYLKTLPVVNLGYGITMSPTLELHISYLVEDTQALAGLKKKCAKNTVFRLKGAPKGNWLVSKQAYSPSIKTGLTKAYMDRIEAFANDDMLAFLDLDRRAV